MAYEISPSLDIIPFIHSGEAVIGPNLHPLYLPMGVPQKSQVGWPAIFNPLMMGASVLVTHQTFVHGVPGETTEDGFFPDLHKPQFRLNLSIPPTPPVYMVMLYHGEPGVLRGDDNWSQETPSYQPQLRTNTIEHTVDPVLVDGTWRVNECFLPSVGA